MQERERENKEMRRNQGTKERDRGTEIERKRCVSSREKWGNKETVTL